MNNTTGEKWFRNVFLKNCGDQRLLLLILDGRSSHESLAILECALGNNVHILSLPPHTTHSLQPLDRSVFGPFSAAYNAACSEFMSENVIHMVNKQSFHGLIKIAWEKSFTGVDLKPVLYTRSIDTWSQQQLTLRLFRQILLYVRYQWPPLLLSCLVQPRHLYHRIFRDYK